MLENIFLQARDLGLGACWINQARDICDDERVRAVLRRFGVPETHIVWGIAIVDYAAHPSPRGRTARARSTFISDRRAGISQWMKNR